jgi:hypothetical protein
MKEIKILIVLTVATLAVFFGGALYLSKVGCEARWKDSGRNYDWSVMADCRVVNSQGHLIPEKNLREFD